MRGRRNIRKQINLMVSKGSCCIKADCGVIILQDCGGCVVTYRLRRHGIIRKDNRTSFDGINNRTNRRCTLHTNRRAGDCQMISRICTDVCLVIGNNKVSGGFGKCRASVVRYR